MIRYIYSMFILILVCSACVKPNISCEFFFNSARINGIDSSTIDISLNNIIIVDTIIKNKMIDTSIPIKKIFIAKESKNIIKIKVNGRDTILNLPDFKENFQVFFYYDNTSIIRDKVLSESSILSNRYRDIEGIKDSMYAIYGNKLDTLHIHFKKK
ncbi:hypothetical protein OKW96_17955 [Sphingobacterium sp. KU25419]|nr:hypothetical protein OKW96_17955 [Sphingobacterium sp. KU25419]